MLDVFMLNRCKLTDPYIHQVKVKFIDIFKEHLDGCIYAIYTQRFTNKYLQDK